VHDSKCDALRVKVYKKPKKLMKIVVYLLARARKGFGMSILRGIRGKS
jgi:hypothetical protein